MNLNQLLLLGSTVIIACILANRITSRFGIPMLLAFIGLGMAFGSEGLFRIPFDNFRFLHSCSYFYYVLRRIRNTMENSPPNRRKSDSSFLSGNDTHCCPDRNFLSSYSGISFHGRPSFRRSAQFH